MDGMRTSVSIYTVLCSIEMIVNIVFVLVEQNLASQIRTSFVFLSLFTQLIIYRCSKFSSNTFIYLLVGRRILLNGIGIAMLRSGFFEIEGLSNECTYLVGEALFIVTAFIYDIVLLSPTYKFSYFIYCPIYAVTHLIYMYLRYDMDDPKIFSFNMSVILVILSNVFIFFYTIQTLDLSRFFQ